jgi:nucleoside-diphosphate-sugar epimerase
MTSSPANILLVTGATGFLGSDILRLARASGWQVRTLVRNLVSEIPGAEAVRGDITDLAALRRACNGVSAVVHSAGLAHVFGPEAKDLGRFLTVNETGTANVVAAARESGVRKIVLVSSVSVYGVYDGPECSETAPCHPQGPYAMSKWMGEQRAIELIANKPASLTILRLSTIYGEGDRGNVAKLINALERRRFIWPGDGLNRKSLIYKEDAARACLCAAERVVPGVDVFNVSAKPASMREIVTAICQALGHAVPRLGIPPALLKAAAAISHGLGDPGQFGQRLEKFTRDDVYSSSKFDAAFDFFPATSLSEGIRKEVSFQRSHGRVDPSNSVLSLPNR